MFMRRPFSRLGAALQDCLRDLADERKNNFWRPVQGGDDDVNFIHAPSLARHRIRFDHHPVSGRITEQTITIAEGRQDYSDCCEAVKEPRKAETIRHKGKKLKDILDAHEKFHKGHPGGERADLSGADLSGADLKKRDLTGANLAGSNLRKADLRGAKLSHADLSRADMRQADLRNCDFTETRLEGADLSEADLSGTELFRGDLRSAKLHKTILRGTVLRQANLRGADFSGSDLALASFREIDLTEVKLDGADLKDAVVRDNRKS